MLYSLESDPLKTRVQIVEFEGEFEIEASWKRTI